MSAPYLAISALRVHFPGTCGLLRAVDGVDLSLDRGERFGLIGESGSGKTMVALSLMGLLPPSARREGSIRLAGRELVGLAPREMRRLRGRELAMIFEQPAAYLDPLFPIGRQIAEAACAHEPLPRREVRSRVLELLARVRMPEPKRRTRQYPFELSGGMQQRAMIAMALAGRPGLLLADEPTTALDPTVQAHILSLLDDSVREDGTTLVCITHDLTAVRRLCRRVAVMYAGQIVETGPMHEVLGAPRHPYTRALCQSLSGRRLKPIAGNPPSLAALPDGCRFHPRCPHAAARCATVEPPLADGLRCHFGHAA
jgi:oligopeptide/dipeptide ABC transporter ATP-binding protein